MPREPDDESDWKSNAEYTMWIQQTSFLILMAVMQRFVIVHSCILCRLADFCRSRFLNGAVMIHLTEILSMLRLTPPTHTEPSVQGQTAVYVGRMLCSF